jgi:HEAT repeat protein
MDIAASPHSLRAVSLLFLLACSAQGMAAQSDPAKSASQAPAIAAPDDQAAPKSTEAATKPAQPLTVRERSWQILHAGLEMDSTEKRVKALNALGVLKNNLEAEKLAVAALKDQKADVRAAAATALGTMQDNRARSALEVALDDNEPAVVLAAANSLMLLKDPNFAYDVYYGVLTGTVRTDNGAIKEQIKEQLKILHDKKKIAQLGLEQGVGFIPYGGLGYGVVKTLVKSDNSPIRAAAAKKLAHDPDPATAKALVSATQDKNWAVRVAALEAIADRGDRSLITAITPALDDDKDEVRYTGAACVIRLSSSPAKRHITAATVASAAVAN